MADPFTHRISKSVQVPDNLLTKLVHRLEAATSRLEDIASSTPNGQPNGAGLGISSTGASGAVTPSQSQLPGAATAPTALIKSPAASTPSISAFDDLIDGELGQWLEISKQLGGVVAEQASAVSQAFTAEKQFLTVATKARKPGMETPMFMSLLEDLQAAIQKAESVRGPGSSRDPVYRDHLAMVAGGLEALGWVTVDSKPAELVGELFGGAQLYGNKVLKEYKEKWATRRATRLLVTDDTAENKCTSNGSSPSTSSSKRSSHTSRNTTRRA